MAANDASRLATVARFDAPHAAHLAKARLDDAGIPCTLAHEDMAGLPMVFDAKRGGIQLKVPARFADEARAVLDASSEA